MVILAIDPGTSQSAYVAVDAECRPLDFGKHANDTVLGCLPSLALMADRVVIEQIGHYGTGMPAGREVFDTCVWIGRFIQELDRCGVTAELVLRATVKAHITGSARAKDANVAQALIDRFAPGEPNRGKGTKAAPGWFYGFKADVWAAYAVAVTAADGAAA